MARYSNEQKAAVLCKLLPPCNLIVAELAHQEDICDAALNCVALCSCNRRH